MIQDRSALVLCIGIFGLLSTTLEMTVGAFAFTANGLSNRATRASSNTHTTGYGSLPRRRSHQIYAAAAAATADPDGDGSATAAATLTPTSAVGLYKQYADYAVEQLLGTGWLEEDSSVPNNLSANQAAAKGAKIESIVRITTKALVPTIKPNDTKGGKPLVRYARITLLETVPLVDDSTGEGSISPDGIQVLNFVVLPNADTTLPVLGIDMVSLPGSRHLLLLDAQPMAEPNPHEGHWEDWYNSHVKDNSSDDDDNDDDVEALKYAWGGDFPEAVQKYVSKYALWTRLQNLPDSYDDDTVVTSPAVDAIRGELFVAFQAHLDAYLDLLGNYAGDIEAVEGENHQPSYLDYRRNNDPAKPMLNSLYGAEWTQSLLDNVLFPKD
jgi:hypothetical protein